MHENIYVSTPLTTAFVNKPYSATELAQTVRGSFAAGRIRKMSDTNTLHQKKWPWIALVCALTLGLVIGGFVYYRGQMVSAKQDRYQELHIIADLKVKQIREWREDRLAALRVLVSSPYFGEAASELAQRPDARDLEARLRRRLVAVTNDYRIQDAFLVGLDGNILLSATDSVRSLDPEAKRTIDDALSNGHALFGDFYRCSVCGKIHIDAAAPIIGKENGPKAVLVFQLDPETDLYPFIRSWPTPCKSAETYLVRNDGDQVLFLNDLRHQSNSALKLREPLTKTDSPAVRAVLGSQGHFQGKDYRGVVVLADILPVPHSPWFLVAKADKEELLVGILEESWSIFLLLIILVILAGVGTGLVFVSRQKSLYEALYVAERERKEAREELRAALYSIGDGVITTDKHGNVRLMNPIAEKLTGWSESEARGRSLPEVFKIVKQDTREEVESPVVTSLREESVFWLANHTVLIARDGSECPIADSGAPVRDENGVKQGTVLVFRDERKDRLLRRFFETRLALIDYAADHTIDELLTKTLDEVGAFVESPIGFYHFVEPDQKTLSLQQWSTRTLQEFCRAEGKGMHYGIEQAGVWVDCVYKRRPVIHNGLRITPPIRRECREAMPG